MFRRLAYTALAVWGLSAIIASDFASAQSRGLKIQLRQQQGHAAKPVQLYGASRALVIGIDDYRAGWPRLNMAVADARAIAEELRERGFEVTLRTNLDSASLDQVLKEFFAIQGADPEARLFLWFAGHGHTINGEGFLIPMDAPPATDPAFKVKALHMRDFGGLVRLADAKHVLSVFDSCFSGTIFTSRSAAAPAAISMKTTKPVRQFLTSGDAGQEVRDDGSFRALFLRAIRGGSRADVNNDGYVTGDELGLYLSQEVTHLTATAQTPRWGRLQDVRFNEGDFVFESKDGGGLLAPSQPVSNNLPAPSSQTNTAEVEFWKSIRDSEDPSDFQAYLTSFPNGFFTDLARNRLARLEPLPPRQRPLPPPPHHRPPPPHGGVQPIQAAFVVLDNANLREKPTTASRRLGSARRNAGLLITGEVVGKPWYQLRLPDGKPAYIHANLVKEVDPSEMIAWYRVKQSTDYRDYRSFIRQFPNGHFRVQAIRKGRALYRAQRDEKLRRRLEAKRLKREEIARQRREKRMVNDLVRLFGQASRTVRRP